MLAPRAVTTGTLGVFAPSSPFDPGRFEAGIDVLRGLGFAVKTHPGAGARAGYLAGPDGDRLAAFHDLLDDPEVDALIAARGGYGLHRIIEGVDEARVRAAKKPVVGFSDICALHARLQQAGLASIHGPVVTQLGHLDAPDHAYLRRTLAGDWAGLEYPADGPAVRGGAATGTLVGGCLSVVAPLVGTPFLFLPEDAILLLEDVGEAPYRVDRMLTHLRLAGVLGRLRGVALGDFVGCRAPRAGEPSVRDVLAERLGDLGIPVLAGLPVGHGSRNLAIPLGARVRLDADARTLTVEGTA